MRLTTAICLLWGNDVKTTSVRDGGRVALCKRGAGAAFVYLDTTNAKRNRHKRNGFDRDVKKPRSNESLLE
jgi:hypothetical protein